MKQYLKPSGITTDTDDLHIGGVRLADIPEVVSQVIHRQRIEESYLLSRFNPDDFIKGFIETIQTLTFSEYEKAFSQAEKQQDLQINPILKYGNTYNGYLKYLQENNPNQAQFFLKWLDAHITEKDRQAHTYLVAGSRSGKSELIKIIIHNYIKKAFSSLAVLDPSGKMVQEIAHFKEYTEKKNAERLIYFDPYLGHKNGVYCVINPFEGSYKDLIQLDRATDELTRAINQILKDTGAEFTDQMGLIVMRMIAVLLYKGNSSFWDLLRFLNNEQNEDLVELGKRHPNQAVSEFFIYRFGIDKDLNSSLGRIKTRIEKLSSNTLFMRSVTGKSTVDLERAMDTGYHILFNFSMGNLGEATSKYLGKLIVAKLQILSMQRQDKDLKKCFPVHVFIDEMQNYITQSIEQVLTQSAKYKYYLTLANQYTGQTDRDTGAGQFYTALLGNTGIKFIGKAGYDTISDMSKEMNVSKDILSTITRGKFYVKVGTNRPFLLTASTRLLDDKHSMTEKEWEQLKEEQLKKYYRKYNEEKPLYTVSKNALGDEIDSEMNQTPKKRFTRKFDL